MASILDWLQHNKEWVFSGVGVTIAAGIVTLFISALKSRAPVRRAPSLQVTLAFGFLTYGPELSDQMMLFTVANPSDRPAQLTSIRLPLKNGGNMVFPQLEGEKRLPCMIEPGTSSKFGCSLPVWRRVSEAGITPGRSKSVRLRRMLWVTTTRAIRWKWRERTLWNG